MRALATKFEDQSSVLPPSDGTSVFDRCRCETLVHRGLGNHNIAIGKRNRFTVVVRVHRNICCNLREQMDGVIGECVTRINDHWKWFDIDDDEFGGINGRSSCFGDNRNDWFTDIANTFTGQDRASERLIQQHERFDIANGEIGVCHDVNHAWRSAGLGDIDRGDVAMGHHRPDINNMKGTVDSDVVDVISTGCQQRWIFFPNDLIPQNAHAGTLPGVGAQDRRWG